MSWGHTWGTAFGGCSAGAIVVVGTDPVPFSVDSARATSSKTYVTEFTQPPTAVSPIGPTDALNLANVELVRLDTNEVIQLIGAATIPGEPFLIEYLLLGSFVSELITYETRHINLVGSVGEIFVDPMDAQFSGMPSAELPREQLRPLLDYFNPQAEENRINGGLVVGTNADYRLEGGVSLMRKLILRRIVTAQDAFFHLSDIEYGLGIQPKELYTESDLIVFRSQLEREVVKEPEITSAKVSLLLKPTHELIITVRAQLRTTNQQIEVSLPLDFTSFTTVVS